MTAVICWVAFMIIMVVIEVVILNLKVIWFGVAALLAAILALFGAPIWAQCLAFGVTAILLILFIKPLMLRKIEAKKEQMQKELEEKEKQEQRESEAECASDQSEIEREV